MLYHHGRFPVPEPWDLRAAAAESCSPRAGFGSKASALLAGTFSAHMAQVLPRLFRMCGLTHGTSGGRGGCCPTVAQRAAWLPEPICFPSPCLLAKPTALLYHACHGSPPLWPSRISNLVVLSIVLPRSQPIQTRMSGSPSHNGPLFLGFVACWSSCSAFVSRCVLVVLFSVCVQTHFAS